MRQETYLLMGLNVHSNLLRLIRDGLDKRPRSSVLKRRAFKSIQQLKRRPGKRERVS